MHPHVALFIKLVPTAIMVLALISCLLYLWYGDYKQAVYWAGAFALNYAMIWM